jgi:hypothetical protein
MSRPNQLQQVIIICTVIEAAIVEMIENGEKKLTESPGKGSCAVKMTTLTFISMGSGDYMINGLC